MRHETAILDPKTQIHKFQLSLFFAFFFSFNYKNRKLAETPIFIVF